MVGLRVEIANPHDLRLSGLLERLAQRRGVLIGPGA